MFKIAILGCENSHANGFLNQLKNGRYPDVTVVGVYSDEEEPCKKLHDEFGVSIMKSYDELVGQVDGIMVTARHGANHYKYAKPYIESGVPMFLDKPITCNEEEAELLASVSLLTNKPIIFAANMSDSDFTAGIEELLGGDMAIFLNGAAGDISTRFTRQESSFTECVRMGEIAAKHIQTVIQDQPFATPQPLRGIHTTITLAPRPIVSVDVAEAELQERTANWEAAKESGADATSLRMLKTYVEGAWVNAEFAKSMAGIQQLHLPITLFSFAGLEFATIPGELFSTLQPEGLSIIAYANGYFRYVCPEEAYVANHYEAMAAIVARGSGEQLLQEIQQLRRQLQDKKS